MKVIDTVTELFEALGWRTGAARYLRLVALIAATTGACVAAALAVAEATSISVVLLQALIWVAWLFWLGVVFPRNRRRDMASPGAYPYRRAFFREILLGISVAFSQFLRPAAAGLLEGGISLPPASALLIGVSLLAGGAAMIAVGVSALGVSRTLFVHEYVLGRREVVRAGIYRFVRHPLFIGGALVSLGLAICTGAAVAIEAGLVNALACPLYARLEDRRCIAILGDEYLDYSADVGGVVPRRRSAIRPAAQLRHAAGSTEPIAGRAQVSKR
ncbi:MAG TPA: methyltransferase [Solirubrobacterales bacterium]|nr:methyltransferase [Solirubrobacterales bacterium]